MTWSFDYQHFICLNKYASFELVKIDAAGETSRIYENRMLGCV